MLSPAVPKSRLQKPVTDDRGFPAAPRLWAAGCGRRCAALLRAACHPPTGSASVLSPESQTPPGHEKQRPARSAASRDSRISPMADQHVGDQRQQLLGHVRPTVNTGFPIPHVHRKDQAFQEAHCKF